MKKSIELKIGSCQIGLPLPDDTDVLMNQEPPKTVSKEGFATDLEYALPSRSLHGARLAVVVARTKPGCAGMTGICPSSSTLSKIEVL